MFDDVPVRAWLIIAIAAIAYPPARYAVLHIANSPGRRDITQAPPDLSWRTSKQFTRSLIILGLLGALAIFIFLPVAEEFARSPFFFPLLIIAMGLWALSTVVQGAIQGRITPLINGIYGTYEREAQPKRYWASLTWNTAFGLVFLWIAPQSFEQASRDADWTRCFDDAPTSPVESRSACVDLISAYDDEIQRNDQDYAARYNRGKVHLRLNNIPHAIDDFSTAIALQPEDPDAYFQRGLLYLASRKYDDAITNFDRAHELNPDDAWPLANRGVAYAWKQDQTNAEKDFAAASAIDPANVVVMRGRSLLSIQNAEWEVAVEFLTASLQRDPDNFWALENRAWLYRQLEEPERAQADQDKLQRLVEHERAAFEPSR